MLNNQTDDILMFISSILYRAPDGTCFMTNSEDNCLRLFNVPQEICNLQLDDMPEMVGSNANNTIFEIFAEKCA